MGFLDAILGRTSTGKYAAALNALTAKQMYSMFSGNELVVIHDKVVESMVSGGVPLSQISDRIQNMTEDRWFCFVSQAFMSIGIPPVFSKEFPRGKWNYLNNPFVALTGAEDELQFARRVLNKNYAADIEISMTYRMGNILGNESGLDTDQLDVFFSYAGLIIYSLEFYQVASDRLFDVFDDVIVSDGYEADYNELFYFIYSIPLIQFGLIWEKLNTSPAEIADNIHAYVNRTSSIIENRYYIELNDSDKAVFKKRIMQYEQPYISIVNSSSKSGLLDVASYNIFKSHETTGFTKRLWEKMEEKHILFVKLLGTF